MLTGKGSPQTTLDSEEASTIIRANSLIFARARSVSAAKGRVLYATRWRLDLARVNFARICTESSGYCVREVRIEIVRRKLSYSYVVHKSRTAVKELFEIFINFRGYNYNFRLVCDSPSLTMLRVDLRDAAYERLNLLEEDGARLVQGLEQSIRNLISIVRRIPISRHTL
ncbi:hypothetical protein AUEXF2481DRAFT_704214 [Aureobasidium subglaciale EXF-2481]|uniref:Uncharacterized protein n=1 Tax=Aureobasidium subglaciale (strain EXF-2481) TaxID=1043005 RepID=A0A074XYM5_AURSE|nr:uncharacterized protein AUEXF2481DRAFT_704214 [Aureobasidium subglaciale EXF-2481]KEQ90570.1 hypothetical protein AUEXF2481DRAFT_704214 [Aureobasidium subglaciale EXF-2481]